MELFDATMITIYAFDTAKNEIISRIKSADRLDEIRLIASPQSIAGWVALEQKTVNIAVITSYSIHYTKLYESPRPEKSGCVSKRYCLTNSS